MSNRKSNSSVKILKELFPHWNDDDLNQVLIDVNGVLESAVARISEGSFDSSGLVTAAYAL